MLTAVEKARIESIITNRVASLNAGKASMEKHRSQGTENSPEHAAAVGKCRCQIHADIIQLQHWHHEEDYRWSSQLPDWDDLVDDLYEYICEYDYVGLYMP